MKRIFFILGLILLSNFVFAQQNSVEQNQRNEHVLIFHRNDGKTIRAFPLPVRMKCNFKNGISQKLILENIRNDSMIFTKYYNQQNFDCKMSDVRSVKVIETNKIFREVQFITYASVTACLGLLSTVPLFYFNPHVEGDAYGILAILFFGIPATFLSSASTVATSDAMPFVFKTDKWTLYVK